VLRQLLQQQQLRRRLAGFFLQLLRLQIDRSVDLAQGDQKGV